MERRAKFVLKSVFNNNTWKALVEGPHIRTQCSAYFSSSSGGNNNPEGEKKENVNHGKAVVEHKENKLVLYAKEFIHELIEGSKKTYADWKYMNNLLKDKLTYTEKYTAYELKEMKRIKKDLFRLVPFSFFMVVPFMEFFLPPYIILFPNAFPSTYIPKEKQKKNIEIMEEKQKEARDELIMQLQAVLLAEGVNVDELFDENSLKELVNEQKGLITKTLNFRHLDSDTLILIAKYLCMEYISGCHIISQLFKHSVNFPRYIMNILLFISRSERRLVWNSWIFNWDIKMNFFPFENLKRRLLASQIEKHLANLMMEDQAFVKYGFQEDKRTMMEDFARQRGSTLRDTNNIIKFFNDTWLNQSIEYRDDKVMYFWNTLFNYK